MVIAVLYPPGATTTGGTTMRETEDMCELEKLLDSAAKLVSIFVLAVFLWICLIII